METKTVTNMKALTFTLETTLKNMMEDVANIPNEITEKVNSLGLEPAGPQVWLYTGCDGNPEKPFELTIAQPVNSAKGYPGKFKFTELPASKVITTMHRGSWNTLHETYMQMLAGVEKQNLNYAGRSREIYHQFDFENESSNITEVQIEILQP